MRRHRPWRLRPPPLNPKLLRLPLLKLHPLQPNRPKLNKLRLHLPNRSVVDNSQRAGAIRPFFYGAASLCSMLMRW